MDQFIRMTLNGKLVNQVISRDFARTKGASYGLAYVVLIYNNNILLQKRSQIESQPGRFDLSAGGHVEMQDANETDDIDLVFQRAVIREAKEELGISLVLSKLEFFTYFYENKTAKNEVPYRKHCHVFTYELDVAALFPKFPKFDRNAIANYWWVSPRAIKRLPDNKITKELIHCRELILKRFGCSGGNKPT